MTIELHTERLCLVPMDLRYLESTHRYAGDLENTRLMMFLPNDTIDDTREFILRCMTEWKKESPADYEFAILLNGVHVGGINVERTENPDEVEIGWCVQKDYWRQGIATEAAGAMLEFARNQLGAKTVIAHCDAENVASYRTMEKLGMHRVSESHDRVNKSSPELRGEYLYRSSI